MSSPVSVNLKYGEIFGGKDILPGTDRPFFFFKGIPYAEPPIGKLRFQPPQALKSFPQSPLDCTQERSVSSQKDVFTSEIRGTEDCLYLNVYTPSIKGQYPVMVHIHGGGFNNGSGNGDLYSPEYLVREGVVVVTMNYRLGVLGFLYLPSVGIYGNMGLKDQQLALEWVKENIGAFGGDSTNITLMGESAGAVCANLHLLNSKSRILFNKIICQSGTALYDWGFQVEPEKKAVTLAEELGCKTNNPEDILNTLMDAKPEELIKAAPKTSNADEKRRGLPLPFRPVIEVPNSSVFLMESPSKLMTQTNIFEGVPIMLGVNNNEGIVNIKLGLSKAEQFSTDMVKFVPMSVNLSPDSFMAYSTGTNIKKFYFGNESVGESTKKQISYFYSDILFFIQHYRTAELISKYQPGSNFYLYRFCFEGKLNLFKQVFGDETTPGACHCDDLCYLFVQRMMEVSVEEDSPEGKIRNLMCKMWTNFAKYGNPTPAEERHGLGFIWEQVKPTDPKAKTTELPCLDIDQVPKMILNPEKERLDFWKTIYSQKNEGGFKLKL